MLTPGWYRFFGVELGAVSGLTGLVLVAVSINLNLVLGLQGLSGRAAEALIVPIGAIKLALRRRFFGSRPGTFC